MIRDGGRRGIKIFLKSHGGGIRLGTIFQQIKNSESNYKASGEGISPFSDVMVWFEFSSHAAVARSIFKEKFIHSFFVYRKNIGIPKLSR